MFGSQALETAVGLALVFWVLASAASAIVEGISRLLNKRAKGLEATIHAMLTGEPATDRRPLTTSARPSSSKTATPATPAGPPGLDVLDALRGTSVYGAAVAASRQGRQILSVDRVTPVYLSARAFADAVTELLDDEETFLQVTGWPGLSQRLRALTAQADTRMIDIKAGLESWFDETMSHLQDAYKRWATAALFAVGLALAVVGNVSTIDAAQRLWQEPLTRQATLDAASANASKGAAANIQTIQDLEQLGLPLGWHHWPGWSWWWAPHLAGWLITALLLMLGAPFWFDALSKLVSLRTGGAKPPIAAEDLASATTRRTSTATRARPAAPTASATAPGPSTTPSAQPPSLATKIRNRVRAQTT